MPIIDLRCAGDGREATLFGVGIASTPLERSQPGRSSGVRLTAEPQSTKPPGPIIEYEQLSRRDGSCVAGS